MTYTPGSPRTAADHAFVTLITSDSYLPGALAQSAALNDLHPTRRGGQFPSGTGLEEEADPVPFTTVCLVTPETVSVGTIKQLRRTFDLVIGVEVIEGDRNAQEIRLLGRPDLHQTFTKLHVLRLAQFASLVFLDADVLPLRPMSHLLNMVSSWPDEYFEDNGGNNASATANPGDILTLDASTVTKRNPHRLHNPAYPCPVSAAPDSGWPDIFNSGVIVLAPPGERGFKQAMGQRSWDGGDQGTLNEWAGSQAGLSTGQGTGGPGWNRLSFKYNVTPTAAYTYAPAYAKFGTGIHAVHFIGNSKPWSGLSFRPPFIFSGRESGSYDIAAYSDTAKGTTPQWRETAYSYHILVDRWYAVYDAHFRNQTDEKDGSKSEFEVQKYESAWEGGKGGQEFTAYDGGVDSGATKPPTDQPNQYPHVVPPHTYHVKAPSASSEGPSVASQPASLEELRRLALHGLGHAGVVRAGEGSYISLPMEGRFTLMRPPPPPTPEPAPPYVPVEEHHHHHHHHEEPFHAPPPPPPQEHHHEHHEHHHHHHHEPHHHHHEPHHHHHEPHHHHHHHEPPHRPPSPPIIAWNPAYEPPPTTAPADNFPINAWYENQWDMPATKDYHHGEEHPGAPEQFFQPPEPEQYIPPELINQGHYSEVTSGGFEPDKTQIKSVFPWEEIERPPPTRAFPESRPLPAPKVKEEPVVPAPPPQPERPSSPPRALGAMYFNAWDDIPSIQRYAARLTGALPPASKPPAPIVPAPVSSEPQKEWSWERDRGDGGDASSRDGDDEEDEDEESEKQATPKASAPTTPAVSNGKSKTKPKSPPSGSISSSGSESVGDPTATTADTGLPTTTPAQTSTPTPVAQVSRSSNPRPRGFELYLSEKRKAQGALDGPKDIRERLALPLGRSIAPIYAPGDDAQPPVLLQIPMSDKLKIAGDVGTALPILAEPSFESSRRHRTSSTAVPLSVVATLGSTLKISSHTQNDSDSSDGELTDDSSSTASASPPSPYEYDSGSAPPPSRAWDETRSVDTFKRESHEALARFLNKGSRGGSPQNV